MPLQANIHADSRGVVLSDWWGASKLVARKNYGKFSNKSTINPVLHTGIAYGYCIRATLATLAQNLSYYKQSSNY